MKNDFSVWADWRVKSLKALEDGIFYVLSTDITGFYENIDLHRLASDLKCHGPDDTLHKLLMTLLNRWATPRNKGIPQGYSGSDILAKVYLDPVDRGMKYAGFKHLRYVDDIRVFCKTSTEAKHALLKLNDLVRKRGLNLQSAKTKIMKAGDARVEIDGVTPLIHNISQQIAKELRESTDGIANYGSLKDIERFLERHPQAPPLEALERAFSENFIASGDDFDKTLFHYLLTRLGKIGSQRAVEYSLRILTVRPEETKYILRYLESFALSPESLNRLLDVLESDETVYEYQLYEIVKWLYDRKIRPDRLLQICRRRVADRNCAVWHRAYCMATLGAFADSSDLDIIEGLYASAGGDVERVEVLMGLMRMENGRRNAFMARVKDDGYLVRCAIDCVRSNKFAPPEHD